MKSLKCPKRWKLPEMPGSLSRTRVGLTQLVQALFIKDFHSRKTFWLFKTRKTKLVKALLNEFEASFHQRISKINHFCYSNSFGSFDGSPGRCLGNGGDRPQVTGRLYNYHRKLWTSNTNVIQM